MNYIVERMWMVIGNTPVSANSLTDAIKKAEQLPLPVNTEPVPETARVVDAYMIN